MDKINNDISTLYTNGWLLENQNNIDDLHEKENFEMKRSFMQDNVIRTDVITCKILGIRKPKLTPDLPRPQFNGSDSDVQWVEIR